MKFKNEWLTECKLSIIFKETRRLQSSKEKTVETTNEKNAEKEKMQKQQQAKMQREKASEIEKKSKNKQWCDLRPCLVEHLKHMFSVFK